MSCFDINEFAHVSFGEIGVCVGLPDAPNENLIEEIKAAALAAGAHWVSTTAPYFFHDEFYDREKTKKSAYFGKPLREIRFYGNLSQSPTMREDFLAIQAKYGFPDAAYRADVVRYCR